MRACLQCLDGTNSWQTFDYKEMPKVLRIPAVVPDGLKWSEKQDMAETGDISFYERHFQLQYVLIPKDGRPRHAVYKELFNANM